MWAKRFSLSTFPQPFNSFRKALDQFYRKYLAQSENKAGQSTQHALSYYRNNQDHMDYAHFRQRGYFIASGTVESACKQIVSMRLKRSGVRWTKSGASVTAKARAAWLSNQWDELTSLPLAA